MTSGNAIFDLRPKTMAMVLLVLFVSACGHGREDKSPRQKAYDYASHALLNESLVEFEKAVSSAPQDAVLRYDMGCMQMQLGHFEQAEETFRQVLVLDPSFYQAHNNLGVVLHRDGRFDEAIQEYEKAISLSPKYVDAVLNLGLTLRSAGKLEASLQAYEKARALSPLNEAADEGIRRLRQQLSEAEAK